MERKWMITESWVAWLLDMWYVNHTTPPRILCRLNGYHVWTRVSGDVGHFGLKDRPQVYDFVSLSPTLERVQPGVNILPKIPYFSPPSPSGDPYSSLFFCARGRGLFRRLKSQNILKWLFNLFLTMKLKGKVFFKTLEVICITMYLCISMYTIYF